MKTMRFMARRLSRLAINNASVTKRSTDLEEPAGCHRRVFSCTMNAVSDGDIMADGQHAAGVNPARSKFSDPDFTADGHARAAVAFNRLDTLWVNTGTLCNVECAHCYIQSSPVNDRLVYLSAAELEPFLNEAAAMGAQEIGFTGGEPFMNPDMPAMTEMTLEHGFETLILTNAMRPMMRERIKSGLLALQKKYGSRLSLRVSLDHYTRAQHDAERGEGSFAAGLAGLKWLHDNGFRISVAGRSLSGEAENALRQGFQQLFELENINLHADDPAQLVIFPEMDDEADTPEITSACWEILGKDPRDMMCANTRMIVKRKNAAAPTVLACTLIAYDEAFDLGETLGDATKPVKLNHPHCSKFCVLGGARCSG